MEAQNHDLRTWMSIAPSKSTWRAVIWNIGVLLTSVKIRFKIKITNPSQESQVSSIAQLGLGGHGCSLDLQIKIASQNLDHGYIKDQ